MADRNSGAWQRFENGAILLLSGTDEIKNLVPGTLRYRVPQRERIVNMDRGVIGVVTIGDQRMCEIEFELHRTDNLDALIALFKPAVTAGVDVPVAMTVKIPDYLGATTGNSLAFAKCFMDEGEEHQASGSGQDADKVRFHFNDAEAAPTPGTY